MDIIKNNKFWLIIGGSLVLMTVLYLVFAKPYKTENLVNIKKIDDKLTLLDRYKVKGLRIKNDKWIKSLKADMGEIEKEKAERLEFLKGKERHIEKVFGSGDGGEIKDEALWKNRYIQRVNQLRNTMVESHVSVVESSLPFITWGEKIPTWDEIDEAQKRFWITEELLDIIRKSSLGISKLKALRFNKEAVSLSSDYSEFYDVISFSISVSMDVGSVLFFINEFAKSEFLFEVETVDIDRESRNIVGVNINAYTIDLKAEGETT